jgi:thiamine biosynthesis protein ThiS
MNRPIMKIQLNGQPHEISSPMSIAELLESLGFGGKPVVVEMDELAIFPRDYPVTRVLEGARIEIVALAAGG